MEKIIIYTDSAYVCNCINQKWYVKWRANGWKNSKKEPVENKEFWVELLDLIGGQEDIKFIKVKGHSLSILSSNHINNNYIKLNVS